jgi:hypothetical protein
LAPEARAQPSSRVSKRDFGIAPDAFDPPVRNGPEESGCAAPTGPGTGGTAAPTVANPMPFLLRGVSRSRNRPNRPNRPNGFQDAPGRLLLRAGVGRFSDHTAESAHKTGPRVERRARIRAPYRLEHRTAMVRRYAQAVRWEVYRMITSIEVKGAAVPERELLEPRLYLHGNLPGLLTLAAERSTRAVAGQDFGACLFRWMSRWWRCGAGPKARLPQAQV